MYWLLGSSALTVNCETLLALLPVTVTVPVRVLLLPDYIGAGVVDDAAVADRQAQPTVPAS